MLAADYDHDFRFAELALRRAIALQPANASALHWLGDMLHYSGRVGESVAISGRALEPDPVSGLGINGLLQSYMMLDRWQEARVLVDRLDEVGYTGPRQRHQPDLERRAHRVHRR